MSCVRRGFLAALATGVGLLASCAAFPREQSVQVVLPPPPAHWQIAFPRIGFLVRSRDSQGRPTEVRTSDWRVAVSVVCARAVNTPILAWPFVSEGVADDRPAGALRPAGGFVPLSLRSAEGAEVVALRWEDGAAALVVDRICAAGRDPSRFNAARLCQYLREADDPWDVDLDAVAEALANGRLTVWDLKALPRQDVCLTMTSGVWFMESPFVAPVASEDGVLRLHGVTYGRHYLYSLAAARFCLDVGAGSPTLRAAAGVRVSTDTGASWDGASRQDARARGGVGFGTGSAPVARTR
jgi:hypothetical protein